jgi:hypothetical protein
VREADQRTKAGVPVWIGCRRGGPSMGGKVAVVERTGCRRRRMRDYIHKNFLVS